MSERYVAHMKKGVLVSACPQKAQIAVFREVARATFVKNQRVNIRLSASDLMDVQARAYEEGVPYQALIASVLTSRHGTFTGDEITSNQPLNPDTCAKSARWLRLPGRDCCQRAFVSRFMR